MRRIEPQLRIDDRFTHVVSTDRSVVLVGEDDAVLLDSPRVGDVLRLVARGSTAVEIADELADYQPRETTHFILLGLERAGVVQHAVEVSVSHRTAPPVPADAVETLARSMSDAWRGRGGKKTVQVRLADTRRSTGTGSIVLVLTDDYLHLEVVEAIHDLRHAVANRMLLARIGVRGIWVGPSYGTSGRSCPECLRERLRLNLVGRALLHVGARDSEPSMRIAQLDRKIPAVAFERLAAAVQDVVDDSAGLFDTADVLRAIDVCDETEEVHYVDRLPQCSVCGDPTLAPPGVTFALTPRRKTMNAGGGYRTMDPEETLGRVSPFVSPLTGVVRQVRKISVHGSNVVHVYTASHARDFGPARVRTIRSELRDAAGGKGRTDLDARVSAICESLERYSAGHRGNEPCHLHRYSEVQDRAIHPDRLLLFSRRQYEMRNTWNEANGEGMQWIPEQYRDDPIEWSPVRSLITGREWLVPSASVYLGFRGEGRRFCRGDSNGLSGGNHLEEALLQGILELVERDAVAIWWYNRLGRPGVDLATSRDDYVEEVVSFYGSLGRSVWTLDLTTDLGIPCFASLSAHEKATAQDIIFGFGAHLDPDIALSRSLTELNQILPSVLRTAAERRAQLQQGFAAALDWWETATVEQHPYLRPADDVPPRRMDGPSPPSRQDLLEDLNASVTCVAQSGCDVLVHDLTRPDIRFPVARVLAPGLRHFWRRLAPGRLYEIPVELGWLAVARTEEEMNPVSMFV